MDRLVYRRRMELVVKPFLKHAEGKRAYVHAIGADLGVWAIRG
jgi:hypothetical protein